MLPLLMTSVIPPAIDHRFAPDGTRSRLLDERAHALLADSLEHIQVQAGQALGVAGALTPLITRIRSGERFGPVCFGLYYQLALAVMDDQLGTARSVAARLVHLPSADASLQLVALDALADEDARLYQTLMDTDPQASFAMQPPPSHTVRAFTERYQRAFGMMQATMPALAHEISGLIREICLVTGDPQAHYQFDGGSSYMLWGGLFLNIASHETDIQLIEVLAHESAHSLLFGHSLDEALVLNEDTELFASPLRVDPRPMDGIYHATFVSARMHWAMSRLLASASLSATERDHAEQARRADTENFEAGYEVVARHGILTATGQAVMDAARGYMNEVRSS